MKVVKFGGTSLADAEQVRKVCDIVAADPERRIVVVSAPGKRNSDDTKVTDLLIDCAEQHLARKATAAAVSAIAERYAEISRGFGFKDGVAAEVEADLSARLEVADADVDAFMDSMKAAGEDNNARLIAGILCSRGVDAEYVNPREAGMLLSGEHGNARVLPEAYGQLKHLADRDAVSVFPGFFGYTPEGKLVTFPRGGSDITGAIIAAAVNADLYENFTDVDSVCAIDPTVVKNATPVAELTYAEMRELSYAGFNVFHEDAIEPAVQAGISICIKNTNDPSKPGTMIVSSRQTKENEVVGIASDDGFCMIYVSKYLMNREIGFLRRLFEVFEDEHVSIEHMPSGIDNISVIVRESNLSQASEQRMLERFRNDLHVGDVYVERGLALVMIVGEGMRFQVGVAARAATALADAGVNIEMMNQGASEISMMFGVKATDRPAALQSLAKAFFT